MTRIRIEGLLAAFPKLVSTGTQHTYVETENVRYVYTPMEQGALYLLLVTNKQSNILEDLDILRLLGKVVPEYTQQQTDEEGISRAAFDLIFAFDEVIALGHKENVTMSQVRTFTEMESHEEKLHKMIIQSKINDTKDVMKRKALEIDKSKIDKKNGRMDGMGGVGVSGMGGGGMGSSGGVGGGSGSGYDDDRFGMGSDELGNRVGGFGGSGSGGMGMGARGGRAEETIKSQAGPTRGLKLGGAKGGAASTNKFLASLAAEGEDMSRASMWAAAPLPKAAGARPPSPRTASPSRLRRSSTSRSRRTAASKGWRCRGR
jgi:coatomer subunit delta